MMLSRITFSTRFCFLISFLLISGPLSGEPITWEKVKLKMEGGQGYSLYCDYNGPEGVYLFHYVVLGAGEEILTEVLEGSSRGAGTRIYYNPKLDRDNVVMQTKLIRLRRSLQARDIKDSPLYQPLFSHLLSEFCEPHPRTMERKGTSTVFFFGDKSAGHECLEVDEAGNPLALRRMQAGKQLNVLTFHHLEWGPQSLEWDE